MYCKPIRICHVENAVLGATNSFYYFLPNDYIQILKKHQRDGQKHLKKFKDGDLVLWLWKDPNIKEEKFLFSWIGPFRVKKAFNNNIVQLNKLNNEDITLVNVNKLKAYQNPIITIITIAIITPNENKIMPIEIPRRIIGGRM